MQVMTTPRAPYQIQLTLVSIGGVSVLFALAAVTEIRRIYHLQKISRNRIDSRRTFGRSHAS